MNDYLRKYVRTDLACESGTISPKDGSGTSYKRSNYGNITVERLEIFNEEGARITGKGTGSYTTISGEALKHDIGQDAEVAVIIENELKVLFEKTLHSSIKNSSRILIAGIGNAMISADSLGPMTAEMISPTRHLVSLDGFRFIKCSNVAVIKTEVLGQTGIESFEIIKAVCDRIKPDVVIAIDALAARSASRLASTIQLSNAGISPGSGIGNTRADISKDKLGIPVISIGVPTVVNSSTLIFDALSEAGINDLDKKTVQKLDSFENFFVTTKDCDITNERLSKILSCAVNGAFGIKELQKL